MSMTPTRDELIAFLRGEAPLDGVWFGEPHPTERGNFWWRKQLTALRADAAQVPDNTIAKALREFADAGGHGWRPESLREWADHIDAMQGRAVTAVPQPEHTIEHYGTAGASVGLPGKQPEQDGGEAHPDDVAVDKFAAAMKAKMAKQRAKGYGGWNDPADCAADLLRERLLAHVGKGDPVDVGNFAMMLFNRGEATASQPSPPKGGAVAWSAVKNHDGRPDVIDEDRKFVEQHIERFSGEYAMTVRPLIYGDIAPTNELKVLADRINGVRVRWPEMDTYDDSLEEVESQLRALTTTPADAAAPGVGEDWPTKAKHVGSGDWQARTAICTHTMSEAQANVWNACLAACKRAAAAPAPAATEAKPAAEGVTEAMVEAACRQFHKCWDIPRYYSAARKENIRVVMSDVLNAALAAAEKGVGP